MKLSELRQVSVFALMLLGYGICFSSTVLLIYSAIFDPGSGIAGFGFLAVMGLGIVRLAIEFDG